MITIETFRTKTGQIMFNVEVDGQTIPTGVGFTPDAMVELRGPEWYDTNLVSELTQIWKKEMFSFTLRSTKLSEQQKEVLLHEIEASDLMVLCNLDI